MEAGWVIIILTILAVMAVMAFVAWSFWLLDVLNRFFETEGNTIAKVLLFLPWLALKIRCFLILVIGAIATLGLAISVANDVRNWWHKEH